MYYGHSAAKGQKPKIQPEAKNLKYSRRPKAKNTAGGQPASVFRASCYCIFLRNQKCRCLQKDSRSSMLAAAPPKSLALRSSRI